MTTLEDPTLIFYERRLDAARETIIKQQQEIAHLKRLANAGHVHKWVQYGMAAPFCRDCGDNLEPM